MPVLLIRLARPFLYRAPRLALLLYRLAFTWAAALGEWEESGRPEVLDELRQLLEEGAPDLSPFP